MKKILSLLLALVMCASLAACGGSSDGPTDAQLKALTDAYQQVAGVYNDAANRAQENGWTADEQTLASLNAIGDSLEPIGLALNGDMASLEGADFDALPAAVLEHLPTAQALLEKVSEPFDAGGAAVITDEALKPLANAYNEVANLYNEVYTAAEANGWLADEQTAAELDAVYAMVTYTGSGLSDDPSKLEDVDLDALAEQLQQLSPALEEMGQRVSVPYSDAG